MFRIKILYIPTGEFLFYDFNAIIWTSNGLTLDIKTLTDRLLTVNEGKFPSWVRENNVQLPLLIEELEIIYV